MRWCVALLFLGLNFYIYHFLATEEVYPPRKHFSDFPMSFGSWLCPQREHMEKEVENNLGVTDYIVCTYANLEALGRRNNVAEEAIRPALVGVYLGYHESQARKEAGGIGGSMIHPPAHCLPGSGWDIISAQVVPLDLKGLPGAPVAVNRLVIAKGDARQLVYYWYQERGQVIARDWQKILDLFWSRATKHRTDGALVRFTVPVIRNDDKTAEQVFREFAQYAVPQLPEFIP